MRKSKEAARDQALLKVLATTKKIEHLQSNTRTLRGDVSHLIQYIDLPLTSYRAIRPLETFRTRTYNLGRQVLELVDHLFVQYPTPFFLYRGILTARGMDLLFDIKENKKEPGNPETAFLEWFLAVGQGRSFAKMVKDSFSKKESHWFLQAPAWNSIRENMLWARAAAAGVSLDACQFLVQRLTETDSLSLDERTSDFLRLFAGIWSEIRVQERAEVMDYFRATFRDQAFSHQGRTLGSIRRLSHEWHRSSYKGHAGPYRSWNQTFEAWEHASKHLVFRAFELTNNRLLMEEGRRQNHCVFSYLNQCLSRSTAIVSLRAFDRTIELLGGEQEVGRITVEVSLRGREIVQIRGRYNRRATDDEMRIIRIWAGDVGLRILAGS